LSFLVQLLWGQSPNDVILDYDADVSKRTVSLAEASGASSIRDGTRRIVAAVSPWERPFFRRY
jgi:hypothetical protein